MVKACLAYYCSGHGYGHATRVSAFACHLLALSKPERPVTIFIVSSAPQHVFTESIACGAHYRYAEIDPVIVQPLAYRVDREKSVQVLRAFLDKKETLLQTEKQWLLDINATAVLSDAAFLGCQAAKFAGIPSVLITNFTFDSVYSYLSTQLVDNPPSANNDLTPTIGIADNLLDAPVSPLVLQPLVDQIHLGYRCADLLIRLPGNIPIPAFTAFPPLPSTGWVDVASNHFFPEIVDHLLQPVATYPLHGAISYCFNTNRRQISIPRSIISAPLFVRPPSASNVYSSEGRSRLLASIGIPEELHDPEQTKILVVSFGGQVFRGPSRPGSRQRSRSATPPGADKTPTSSASGVSAVTSPLRGFANGDMRPNGKTDHPENLSIPEASKIPTQSTSQPEHDSRLVPSRRLTTPSHMWIPGAPPALKLIPPTPLVLACPRVSSEAALPPYQTGADPETNSSACDKDDGSEEEPRLLPDSSWIAIICGVSKEQWIGQLTEERLGLPDRFFVAPRDVYMPDLTAVGDALLGKLVRKLSGYLPG
ncbi:hypothetical protein AX17_007325 [Amanita inopinata Kibby_2008]|nr:hypothetical protein AX17_007325 [Amanita inopinata Kibby_2008]